MIESWLSLYEWWALKPPHNLKYQTVLWKFTFYSYPTILAQQLLYILYGRLYYHTCFSPTLMTLMTSCMFCCLVSACSGGWFDRLRQVMWCSCVELWEFLVWWRWEHMTAHPGLSYSLVAGCAFNLQSPGWFFAYPPPLLWGLLWFFVLF